MQLLDAAAAAVNNPQQPQPQQQSPSQPQQEAEREQRQQGGNEQQHDENQEQQQQQQQQEEQLQWEDVDGAVLGGPLEQGPDIPLDLTQSFHEAVGVIQITHLPRVLEWLRVLSRVDVGDPGTTQRAERDR